MLSSVLGQYYFRTPLSLKQTTVNLEATFSFSLWSKKGLHPETNFVRLSRLTARNWEASMRKANLSAVCSLLLLLCSDSALAQSSPVPAEAALPQISLNQEPRTAGLLEPQKARNRTLRVRPDATSHPVTRNQTWLNRLGPQDGSSGASDFRAERSEPAIKGILPQMEPSACAHILIFQAPETDSEMIVSLPPGTGGEITTYKGWGPCCRDLRPSLEAPKFPGLRLFPQRPLLPERPFVPPPSTQPKNNHAASEKP